MDTLANRRMLAPRCSTALKTLEYRGYDSWGMAIGVDGRLAVTKTPGKISAASVDFPDSDIGFGHTRWATHGGGDARPMRIRISIAAAGSRSSITESSKTSASYATRLRAKGHTLRSETDSEVDRPPHRGRADSWERHPQQALDRVFARLSGLGRGDRARSCQSHDARDQTNVAAGGWAKLHQSHDRFR